MELRINKIRLENFKGIKKKEIVFDGKSAKLCGANGTGKTSTYDAVLFVFTSVNSKLVNNPPVTPIGASEVLTSVEIECTLDDKPLKVGRTQKYKEKIDPDTGKITANTISGYSINDVEYNQTNFVKNLTERGIDLDHFLYLCHPDAFTADTSAKGREKIREILFSMIDDISDTDIVKKEKLPELKALLEQGYTIQEIDAMSKASLRKINERYGKSNEILDGRIQGIIQSKSQLDIKELEKTKKEYETELEQVRKDFNALRNKDSGVEAKIAELEGKCDDLERAETRKLEERKASVSEKLRKAEETCKELNYDVVAEKSAADRILQDLDGVKESLEHYRAIYKKTQDEVFDKDATVCPTCGRAFPKSEVEEMKKKFEESKTKRLSDYKKMGEMFKVQVDTYEAEYKDQMAKHDKKHKDWLKADEEVAKLTEQYRGIPTRPNMADNSEYQKLRSEIDSLRESLSNQDDDFKLSELSKRESYLTHMIIQTNGEIAVVERNKELDKDIEALRQEKRQAEIDRSKNEKIIDQVKTFEMRKNDLLSNEINEKFSMVNWKLWDYQKNGEVKSICEPYIDSKPMSSAANGSLITLCKISICADLQRHFGFIAPIWCEDYSLFSSNTASRINTEGQLIGLVVTEDKELKVEEVS